MPVVPRSPEEGERVTRCELHGILPPQVLSETWAVLEFDPAPIREAS